MSRHSFLCRDMVSLLQQKTMSRHSFLCHNMVSLLQQKTVSQHSFSVATENFIQLVGALTSSF